MIFQSHQIPQVTTETCLKTKRARQALFNGAVFRIGLSYEVRKEYEKEPSM